ncbi:MAG TPA: hypothetical protein VFE58_13095 [Tepidisphaeraceae bacterium]|jgi:hypothetical protein|nr:hypothetical protein [Tepidisphaeraceae bacterium]
MSDEKIDALKMKRQGAERIYQRTRKMSQTKELAYWTDRNEQLRVEQARHGHRIKSKRKVG